MPCYFLAHVQPYLWWHTPWVADEDRSPRGANVENCLCIDAPHRGHVTPPAEAAAARSSASR